jgi:hypothetical protein
LRSGRFIPGETVVGIHRMNVGRGSNEGLQGMLNLITIDVIFYPVYGISVVVPMLLPPHESLCRQNFY